MEQGHQAKPISQILETMASSLAQRATERPSRDSREKWSPEKRRAWLDKWLRLRITHPQLAAAELEIFKLCGQYFSEPARGRTVVIYGENGSGKSHIAKAVNHWANRVAIKMPLVVREDLDDTLGIPWTIFANWPKVVDGFQKRQDFSAVDPMLQCSLLILDDLGAEHDPSKYGASQLYLIFNHNESQWKIVTTNKMPSAWESAWDRRVASRLHRNAQHIDLSEVPDYSTI